MIDRTMHRRVPPVMAGEGPPPTALPTVASQAVDGGAEPRHDGARPSMLTSISREID